MAFPSAPVSLGNPRSDELGPQARFRRTSLSRPPEARGASNFHTRRALSVPVHPRRPDETSRASPIVPGPSIRPDNCRARLGILPILRAYLLPHSESRALAPDSKRVRLIPLRVGSPSQNATISKAPNQLRQNRHPTALCWWAGLLRSPPDAVRCRSRRTRDDTHWNPEPSAARPPRQASRQARPSTPRRHDEAFSPAPVYSLGLQLRRSQTKKLAGDYCWGGCKFTFQNPQVEKK